MPAVAATLVQAALDTIFPPRCTGCGRLGMHFCPRCIAQVEPVRPPWCASCGVTISYAGLCTDCRSAPLDLHAVRSAGLLHGPLRRAVHRLKYRARSTAAGSLAALMAATASQTLSPTRDTLVVPVPLHAARERERGYNQATTLATALAASLGLELAVKALERVRQTASQVGMTRAQRRANVAGAFAAHQIVGGRPILLVDDVVTTGSTLGSAAAACRTVGAGPIYAVTLAREA
jgi:ComF family protein